MFDVIELEREWAVWILTLFVTLSLVACGGGGGGSSSRTPSGTLVVTVDAASDHSVVTGASIAVYNSSNQIVATWNSDVNGEYETSLSPGTYYVKITAQDYNPLPLTGQSAIPFEIVDNQTTTESYSLDAHPSAGTTGQFSGTVALTGGAGVAGMLIVAGDSGQNLFASAISGIDGVYEMYNVPPGNYTLTAYRAGYRESTEIHTTVAVAVDDNFTDNDISIEENANANLSGQVTFLAIANGTVDITLVHPDTRDTIPGCSTTNDGNNNYTLVAVPPGTFIAWASFRNDGYIIDPDNIAKFGLPEVTFSRTSGDQTQDFSVTGSVTIVSPTNAASPVAPQVVNTATPTFTWESYPSAKEYIIEVFDSQGNTIWGGYDASGVVVNHAQIGASATSVAFNFDGSAIATLQDGQTYRWKIYADDDATLNIQNLISASEEQMGLFTYQAP